MFRKEDPTDSGGCTKAVGVPQLLPDVYPGLLQSCKAPVRVAAVDLPVDLIIGLVEPEEETTPKGYAKQWAHRMSEAYKIAENHSRQSSARGKAQYDRKMSGVVLKAGDQVLVRNLGERGGPGKLRSYWEKAVYVVKEQVSNSPVYVVYPENSDSRKTRTLHRNLLLLVNDLPVEAPATTPGSTRPENQKKKTVRHTSNDNMDDKDSDLASSDAESSAGGYWLRAPVNWPTSGSDQLPEQAPVRETIHALQGRENPEQSQDRKVQVQRIEEQLLTLRRYIQFTLIKETEQTQKVSLMVLTELRVWGWKKRSVLE
ncbi:hypothetical protein M9458_003525, partial [Cirrhinus mrigala]